MTVSYVDRQTLAAIAPSVTKALAIDNTRYGLLLSAFSMAYLAFAPLAGVVVDRLGARRGFAASVLVWSVVAGGHALVASFGTLFALRILLGMAEAPSFPAATQTVRRALPGARQSLAVGLLFTGSSVGAMVAGELAVRLEAAYGFRGAFLGTAAVGALWLPAWLWVTRGHGLDEPVVKHVHLEGNASPSWAAMALSAPVLRSVLAVIGSAPALMVALNWTSKYLVDSWGVPKAQLGHYLVVCPLLFDIGSVGFGALASRREARHGPTPRTHADLLIVAMLLACVLALAPLARSPGEAMVLFGSTACGCGGLYALVTADMIARVSPAKASSAGGMTAAAQSLALVIAFPLVGWTIDRTHSYGAALVGLGVAVIPATIAFVAWPGMSSASVTSPPSETPSSETKRGRT
jgi:ACS family hexuronate transporter-like MFS transporter